MKKIGGLFAFLTILFSSFVSAGPVEGLETLLRGALDVVNIVIIFITDLILNINSFDELLFAKLLLFTLILVIVYTVIKENGIFGGRKNKPVQWIIASAVSILAIRYLPDNFVQAILLQYGALAVGLTVFFPLLIYFFFIHQSGIGPFGRKAGWVVFAASFFALWSFRYEDLGEANLIYWIAIGFVAVSLLFDKRIHEYFGMSSIRRAQGEHKVERRVEAQKKLNELENNKQYLSEKEYDKLHDRYTKIIKENI